MHKNQQPNFQLYMIMLHANVHLCLILYRCHLSCIMLQSWITRSLQDPKKTWNTNSEYRSQDMGC